MMAQIEPFPGMTLVAPRLPLVDLVAIAPKNKAKWHNATTLAGSD
jgi:hypothetical protein